ncbi:hypothetical protein L2E82_44185 [Cichorium intybus]|uniref:Uncharacterized protein n=1 Tax=Cichorium intybus TaxID=13427 RepID=A0ACB8ZQ78_CICIN|nr:hypothetical protein L2E82_44185 [Cichorium intybus]
MKGACSDVVKLLLDVDATIYMLSDKSDFTELHVATRKNKVADPQLARITDKKGQTALHMAMKGACSDVVKLLLDVDATIYMLSDKSDFTALHVATRKNKVAVRFDQFRNRS